MNNTQTLRYVVENTGTVKRPWEVRDTLGGWVCFCTKSHDSAAKRAAEMNAKSAMEVSR